MAPMTCSGSRAGGDCVRQWSVGGLQGEVLLAGVEPDERAAAAGRRIAKRAAQHRVFGFERVEHLALRSVATDVEFDFSADVRQGAEVLREPDADHGKVWTSTESTRGRSRTIGFQVSPWSAEA